MSRCLRQLPPDPHSCQEADIRTLVIDIETFPNTAHVWRLWGEQNVGLAQLQESASLACWAAKWVGDRKIHFASVHADGRFAMLEQAYDLIQEADAIVHYNGRRFDMPYLRTEFVRQGWTRTSGYYDIDLCSVVKREFSFPSNKLQHVAGELLGEGKESTGGHQLWVDCMAGDEKAWARMRRYNIGDVKLTERLYDRLRPWCKGVRVA